MTARTQVDDAQAAVGQGQTGSRITIVARIIRATMTDGFGQPIQYGGLEFRSGFQEPAGDAAHG